MRHAAVALGTAAAAVALAAVPASAHVQVTPALAAPGDPVLFSLLVPNEREDATTEVQLRIPVGVLAFSFEGTPGWTRTQTPARDGSVGVVRWTGRLPVGGFARFAFLATTPERAGDLAWKAIQRYADGTTVRWIGAPGSETPAAVTRVAAGAARQNAGGESLRDGPAASPATRAPAAAASGDGGRDPLALALGAGGLLLGGAALAVALRRR